MTLVSSIITDAFRESNILALGKDPNDNQSAEALRLFNTILAASYGGDAGEPLTDWPLGNFDAQTKYEEFPVDSFCAHYPLSNRRLIATNLGSTTVYLPEQPQDGARMAIADPFGRLASVPVTLDANGRTIQGVPTLLVNVNGTFSEWFYRADLGDWRLLSGVGMTDDMPFPARFDAMFSILLSMRINPRYGRTLDQQSMLILKQSKQEFVARYLQSAELCVDDSISWPFLSRQSYGTARSFSSTSAFNQGRIC